MATAQPLPPVREGRRRGTLRGDHPGRIRERAAVQPAPAFPPREIATHTSERQELLCSVIGLTVKLGAALLAGVSLFQLAGAYQERLDRHGELSAILDIESMKLRKAQERFDQLFSLEGERLLLREQDQWIAPNRLRVVWEQPRQKGREASELKASL